MTVEFQEQLLKYLFQHEEAKIYTEYLDSTVFDTPTWIILYDMWADYIKKYKVVPSKPNFIEYYDRVYQKNRTKISDAVNKELRNCITAAYLQLQGDIIFIKEMIVDYAQKKKTKQLFKKYSDKVNEGDASIFEEIQNQMAKIVRLGTDSDEAERNRGGFLLRELDTHVDESVIGEPTFLRSLNKMTASGGFYSPQHIVFLAGPKVGKTNLLINLILGYIRDGYNVYLADTENGLKAMRLRLKQALLECERHEIKQYKTELRDIVKRMKYFGGDLNMGFYPPDKSTLNDVDADLERIWAEDHWKPNVIIYDYLTQFKSTDKSIKEKHLQIQHVTNHAVALNNKWNTFSFTAGKVKAPALKKLVITVEDFGEDSAQAYNVHAAFAVCRNDDEVIDDTARIIPVVQRDGVPYKFGASTTCCIHIDNERQHIEELDSEVYLEMMQDKLDKKEPVKAVRPRKFKNQEIKDE